MANNQDNKHVVNHYVNIANTETEREKIKRRIVFSDGCIATNKSKWLFSDLANT